MPLFVKPPKDFWDRFTPRPLPVKPPKDEEIGVIPIEEKPKDGVIRSLPIGRPIPIEEKPVINVSETPDVQPGIIEIPDTQPGTIEAPDVRPGVAETTDVPSKGTVGDAEKKNKSYIWAIVVIAVVVLLFIFVKRR